MAYKRLSDVKDIGGELDTFVDGQMKLFSRQLTIRNAEEEVKFNEAVLAGNITLEQQLQWRQDQLKRIGSTDPEERRRIRQEVASLKDQIENRKFSDQYLEKLTQFESGATSIDNVITWLSDQLATATDDRVKQDVQTALKEQKAKRYGIEKQIIENQTQYAINDKSDEVLSNALDRVRTERNKAQLSGDTLLVSLYDLQAQALEKAQTENGVQRSVTTFAVNTLTNGMNAVGLLDAYTNEIGKAPTSGNIQIGGSLFGSAAEFWRYKRGQYLTDSGADGFFGRYTTEQKTQLAILNGQRPVTVDDIKQVIGSYNSLKTREEFRGFDYQIDAAKFEAIQTGADYAANSVLNTFRRDFDLNKAVQQLNTIKGLGASLDDTYTTLLEIGAQNKNQQISGILNVVQDILSKNPNVTAEAALNQAIASGAGTIISPEQAAGQSEKSIVDQQIAGAQGEKFTTDPRTTAPGVESPPIVPASEQTPTAGATKYTFSSQFDLGAQSEEVKQLQKFLNQAGYKIADSGPGSPGNETDYYGPLTQAAVQKFQKEQGIVSSGDPASTGYGRVGPKTLEALNSYKL